MARLMISAFIGLMIAAWAGFPRAAELVMFEAAMCDWCETWDEEVGVVYGKTTEAQIAPLRRVDISDERPAHLRGVRGIHFTPTFVLMDGQREVGRIMGYPGESFFWELLGGLMKKLPHAARACATPSEMPANGGQPC